MRQRPIREKALGVLACLSLITPARRDDAAPTFFEFKPDSRTVENLATGLKAAGLDRSNLVSLMVYLPGYESATEVSQVLAAGFGSDRKYLPAITLVGIAGSEAGRVRMDAIATTRRGRESFRHKDVPLAQKATWSGFRIALFDV